MRLVLYNMPTSSVNEQTADVMKKLKAACSDVGSKVTVTVKPVYLSRELTGTALVDFSSPTDRDLVWKGLKDQEDVSKGKTKLDSDRNSTRLARAWKQAKKAP